VTGSFTTALLYDRYQRRKAQQKWCNVVSHLAQEPLPTTQMPRRITVFLSAPPGDGLRAAREHFHEYVKPVLVAGALDWDVVEGRKEGEVRAGLAARIRRLRRRNGEKGDSEDTEESTEDRLEAFRRGAQIRSWDGVQGDLVLGRHAWKEYVRGLHEGWLGPLDEPQSPRAPTSDASLYFDAEARDIASSPIQFNPTPTPDDRRIKDINNPDTQNETGGSLPEASLPSQPSEKPPEKPPTKPSPTPPYLRPEAYSTSPLPASTPSPFPPSTILPFPHILGFLNTPIRVYRFLTRRYLTDSTGQLVATLVLASNTRSYERGHEYISNADLDGDASSSAPSTEVVEAKTAWEQESILSEEESEWHKSARAPNANDAPDRERPWQEKMVVDDRIGARMRAFDLPAEERDQRLENAEGQVQAKGNEKEGSVHKLSVWLGLRKENGMKGWEMGLVGEED